MRKYRIKKQINLVGVLLFTAVFAVISAINWRSPDLTYSQHISLSGWSIVLFCTVNTIVAICLAAGLLGYIKPRWKFGKLFALISLIFVASLLMIGWFPDLSITDPQSVSVIIHRISAGILFASAFAWIALVTISRWKKLNIIIKIAGVMIMIYAFVSVVSLLLFLEPFVSVAFFVESGYLFSILIYMLLINYSKPKNWFMVQLNK